MTREDQTHWDARYAAADGAGEPAALVAEYAPPPHAAARALDVACGRGRHTLFLAERGYLVDAVDISPVALAALADDVTRRELGGRARLIPADLDAWRPQPDTYDLVVQIAFFDRRLLPHVMRAVRPGGRLVMEVMNTRRLERHPDTNPAFLAAPDELAAALAGWTILHTAHDVGDTGDSSQIVAEHPGP